MLGIVRLLVRLYPTDFRARYGDEVVSTYARLIELSQDAAVFTRLRVALRALVDVASGVVREHIRALRTKDEEDATSARTKRIPGQGVGMMGSGWIRDLRWAVRGVARRPLFTLVAAGSLAIGIGANTAVFSVANAVLVQPPAGIPNYDQLVDLGRTTNGSGYDTFAYPDFADIRSEVSALDGAAAYSLEIMSVSRASEGLRVSGMLVSASYFDLLGSVPLLGRYFLPEEDVGPDQHPVVVVSERYWRERLGSDPDIVGSSLLVNRSAYTVVEVTAENFESHIIGFAPSVYIPLMQAPSMNQGRSFFEERNSSWLLAIGLRAPNASTTEVNAQLEAVASRLAGAYPGSNADRGFAAIPLGPVPGGGRDEIRLFMLALSAMVGLILMVTCMNVAGMFLSRAVSRQREVAVRRAIGASRGTIVQQLTIETLVVFLLGGGLGIFFGYAGVGLLRPELLPTPIPLRFEIKPDTTVTLVALLVTLTTGILFGLLPAVRATGFDVAGAMRDPGGETGRGSRLRAIFAASQVGLSLVLLVAAGLFVRSLQRASTIDTGFDDGGAIVTYLDLELEGYDRPAGSAFQAALLDRFRGQGWVEAAALATDLPLDMSSSGTVVLPEGWSDDDDRGRLSVDINQVSGDYFTALGIRVLAGRPIDGTDTRESGQVAVVSQYFAEQAWPDQNPLGKVIYTGRVDEPDGRYEVVGVADDVKNMSVTDRPKAFAYFALPQRYRGATQLVVRPVAGAPDPFLRLRETIREADPDMAIGSIMTLAAHTSLGTLPQRIAAALTSWLGLVALLLSGLGIYGVVSYAVGRKRREIGIRMALGADSGQMVRKLVQGGLLLALPGLALGALASVGVGRMIQLLLLDLSPFDPIALGTVSMLLLAVVLVASWIPARRAALVDPSESLRGE